jgi:hypothetical protein
MEKDRLMTSVNPGVARFNWVAMTSFSHGNIERARSSPKRGRTCFNSMCGHRLFSAMEMSVVKLVMSVRHLRFNVAK